jgi:hypothetical protein
MANWSIVSYQALVAGVYIWLVNRPDDSIEYYSAKLRYLFLGLGTAAGANAVYGIIDAGSVSAVVTVMIIAFLTMIFSSFQAGRYYRARMSIKMVVGLLISLNSLIIFTLYYLYMIGVI